MGHVRAIMSSSGPKGDTLVGTGWQCYPPHVQGVAEWRITLTLRVTTRGMGARSLRSRQRRAFRKQLLLGKRANMT